MREAPGPTGGPTGARGHRATGARGALGALAFALTLTHAHGQLQAPSERAAASRTSSAPAPAAAAGTPAAPALRAAAAAPRLGRPVAAADAARADLTVFPDGRGLPPGSGTALEGQAVYEQACARCHGPAGSGGNSGRLVGREPLDSSARPEKTIGQFWPLATTLFDYTRRAMLMDRPGSLTDAEVYAVTAYLLFANNIVAQGDAMNAATLPRVHMPNRDGFLRQDDPALTGRPAAPAARP